MNNNIITKPIMHTVILNIDIFVHTNSIGKALWKQRSFYFTISVLKT